MMASTKSRKAQIQAQTIMYVFGVIIVGAILVFGFKAIGSFKQQGDSIQMMKFKETIIDTIDTISQEYNSVQPVNIMGPGGKYNELCFSSLKDKSAANALNNILTGSRYALILDATGEAKENAFILSDIGLEESFYVGNIDVDDGSGNKFFCIKTNGNKFGFMVTGQGNKALISPLE